MFLVLILGPTGIGKTSLSIFLAKKLKTQILSCDSRQFFKELKIGTSMPNLKDRKSIPHHFIGHLSIHDNYNARLFEIDSLKKMQKLFLIHPILIMVGGSGLYEKSVTEGLSEIPKIDVNIRNDLIFNFKKKGISFLKEELNKIEKKNIPLIDLNNPRRLIRFLEIIKSTGKPPHVFFKKKRRNFSIIKIGLTLPRDELYSKINTRVEKMIKMGLFEEAKTYYIFRHLNSLQTIGYKDIFDFLSKKKYSSSFVDVIENIKKNTRRYAKRQICWYKKDFSITWFHPKNREEIFSFILRKTNGQYWI
ncbi:tRNA (adenosine(37)-N6)-dimethylallyltransferase MiaA [Blattabacterium cuenoti]|uniref:tRNA (adenosine(37)-N6)-dimethylallyltransferase MiaA n=1 Tax=Blattabacterium cuenoti TaxID=1653831 RepID=UPI001EEB6F7F|nr:tRNA (adenosine(37)-N6)-dimethylallyltransferase MiaA [Blattabacterium cuenoti]